MFLLAYTDIIIYTNKTIHVLTTFCRGSRQVGIGNLLLEGHRSYSELIIP